MTSTYLAFLPGSVVNAHLFTVDDNGAALAVKQVNAMMTSTSEVTYLISRACVAAILSFKS